jgi:epoxyqueuosine reductase
MGKTGIYERKIMPMPGYSDSASWMTSIIRDFIHSSPANRLWNDTPEKFWEDPLVGFSAGNDPIYDKFKEHIGPFYWTPLEIFRHTFKDVDVSSDGLTVISWILPQTEVTKRDNRKETVYPAERWARSRIFGEESNVELRRHAVSHLLDAGSRAVAPLLSPDWSWQTSDKYGFASNWSERHAAYASGLGTFGLCDGLITSRGKAMRAGSIVAEIQIPPTPRPYKDHHEYCLFFSEGTCRKCMKRCPVGAITEGGHDKTKCFEHLAVSTAPYVKSNYGFDGYGCGLCQTEVPCESGIPKPPSRK